MRFRAEKYNSEQPNAAIPLRLDIQIGVNGDATLVAYDRNGIDWSILTFVAAQGNVLIHSDVPSTLGLVVDNNGEVDVQWESIMRQMATEQAEDDAEEEEDEDEDEEDEEDDDEDNF